MKDEARQLRREGKSYGVISKELGVCKSTVSSWVRDIVLSEEEIRKNISSASTEREHRNFRDVQVDCDDLESNIKKFGLYGAKSRMGLTEGCIKYWAQQYNIKIHNSLRIKRNDNCQLCGKEYACTQKKKGKFCNTCVSKMRRLGSKIRAIDLKGGQCEKCGYEANDKNYASFEFHHTEDNKERSIGGSLNMKWSAIESELKKCQLLCSNCHRIHHSDYDNENLVRVVKEKYFNK